ncbi:MAG: RDD family protein [Bacillales bacterium]|nr:RDD family protein [Bacillales bacterium]
MINTIHYQKSSIFRRIAASIFDFIVLISLFFLLESLVVTPIIKKTTDYNAKYQEYCSSLEATHLFKYYKEYDSVTLISSNYDEQLTLFYKENFIGHNIEEYYTIKYENSDVFTNENGEKLQLPLFIYISDTEYSENKYQQDSEGNFIVDSDGKKLIDAKKQEELKTFYSELVNKLANEYCEQEEITNLTMHLSALTMLSYLISIVPSYLFVYLLFPLVFKDGTTIGKKLLQMQVIDQKSGKLASRFQNFIRFTFNTLLSFILALFSYGITLLVSLIMLFATKNRQTLADFIAKTIVVKSNTSFNETEQEKDMISITFDDGKQ